MWHAGNSKFAKQKGPWAEFAGQIKFGPEARTLCCSIRPYELGLFNGQEYMTDNDMQNMYAPFAGHMTWSLFLCECQSYLISELNFHLNLDCGYSGSRTEVHTEWDPELTKNCNTKCYCPQQWVSSEALFVEFRNLLSLFIVFFGHHYNRIRSTKSFQNSRSFIQQSLSSERTFPQFKAPTFMIVIQQLVLVLKVFHDRQIKVLLSIVSSNLIRRVENGWWNGNH